MPTELQRKLSIHPLDVLAGTLVPQMQSYATCVPATDVDAPAFRARLVALMRERFPRFCYRLVERWGAITELRLADDLGAPVSVTTPEVMRQLSVREMEASLGERQRMAVLLSKFEEMSYAHIAEVMELSPQATKSLLSRARENLREILVPYLTKGQKPPRDGG